LQNGRNTANSLAMKIVWHVAMRAVFYNSPFLSGSSGNLSQGNKNQSANPPGSDVLKYCSKHPVKYCLRQWKFIGTSSYVFGLLCHWFTQLAGSYFFPCWLERGLWVRSIADPNLNWIRIQIG
jgi:hypothetical protein